MFNPRSCNNISSLLMFLDARTTCHSYITATANHNHRINSSWTKSSPALLLFLSETPFHSDIGLRHNREVKAVTTSVFMPTLKKQQIHRASSKITKLDHMCSFCFLAEDECIFYFYFLFCMPFFHATVLGAEVTDKLE